ncbi:hypothetical protein CQA53_00415 [Helicobacter didelphidarum]|uniref:SIMPL domain-containing protein n=1 Tax=Helicobacter didelphidarum TaxID=2040648 RepID=A0A3D8ISD2_9HELI|nr:SIMPL domain-containing protein [Helicobacter didelphidarum]RDU67524.1 hypothetical protein CQA53_00415 [Helicobacter didelphidarum]
MFWVKSISIAVVLLALFVGGILFDIFVVKKMPVSLHSGNKDSLKISQQIKVNKMVTPTSFRVRIAIRGNMKLRLLTTINEVERQQIMTTFNTIIALIKENSSICSGGENSIGPEEYWENNGKTKQGYNAIIQARCEFNESQKDTYITFLNKVIVATQANDLLAVSVPPLESFVPEKERAKYTGELKDSIIQQAKDMSQYYAKNLSTTCKISKIDFPYVHFPMSMVLNAKSVVADSDTRIDVKLPVPEEQEVRIDANVEISCE